MKRRVVVTGMGAVTPIGNTVEEFWNGIKTGKVGIGPITKFDTTDYKVKLAAEVKDFVGKERMDFKAAKRMELFSQYAVAAAKEAFADAGLDMEQEDPCGNNHRFRYRKSQLCRAELRQDPDKRTGACKSIDGSADDLQYGSRKCIHPAWTERKMYRCRDSMCIRI